MSVAETPSLAETLVPEPPPLRLTEHGVLMVGRTRVPLDTVIGEYHKGAIPEEIVLNFDSLDLADVYAVISYYLRHRAEVDAYLEARLVRADEIRREHEARYPAKEFRERLLARQQARQERSC